MRSESPPSSPQLRARLPEGGAGGLADVEPTFRAFCGSRQDLDGRSFSKLCRDCHLVDRGFAATDADLVFAKVVPSGQRRMDLARFEAALRLIADRKAVDEHAVRQAVAGSSGPTLHCTKTEPVRFHDDKSTYTGTHAHAFGAVIVRCPAEYVANCLFGWMKQNEFQDPMSPML